MKFKKKNRRRSKSLYPVLYVIGSLKDYHRDLVQSEVSSLWELNMVSKSFSSVLNESENFKGTIGEINETFSNINTVSSQFASVKENISQSVVQAQGEIEELKYSALMVQTHFDEMQETFEEFQQSLKKIKGCMGKIVSIADQTNILSLNASIEAARAGEKGKGFAVVAEEIRRLSVQSVEAVKQIRATVEQIDKRKFQIAETTGQASDTVRAQSEAMKLTVGSFCQVRDSVTELTKAVNDITSIMERMGRAKDRTLEMIDSMAKVSENNEDAAAGMQQNTVEQSEQILSLQDAVQILGRESDKLKEAISKFTI